MIYIAPCYLRQAKIYERKGERQKAIKNYSAFIDFCHGSCRTHPAPAYSCGSGKNPIEGFYISRRIR